MSWPLSSEPVISSEPENYEKSFQRLLAKHISHTERQQIAAEFSSEDSLNWLLNQLLKQTHPEIIERITSIFTRRNAASIILNILEQPNLYDLTHAALVASLEWLEWTEIPPHLRTQAETHIRSALDNNSPEVRESAIQSSSIFPAEQARTILRKRLDIEPNQYLQRVISEAIESR